MHVPKMLLHQRPILVALLRTCRYVSRSPVWLSVQKLWRLSDSNMCILTYLIAHSFPLAPRQAAPTTMDGHKKNLPQCGGGSRFKSGFVIGVVWSVS